MGIVDGIGDMVKKNALNNQKRIDMISVLKILELEKLKEISDKFGIKIKPSEMEIYGNQKLSRTDYIKTLADNLTLDQLKATLEKKSTTDIALEKIKELKKG